MSNDVLRDQLLEIQAAAGYLTPEAVVEAARSEDSPLHGRFEWNDSVAAERYRKDQARDLIRSVKVEFVDGRGEPQAVRAFHSVRSAQAGRPVYQTVEKIAEDDIAAQQLLRQMDLDWRSFKRRYGNLDAFLKLMAREAAAAEGRESALAG